MTPADIVKADRLSDKVCHPEQLDIWAEEAIFALSDWLRDPEDYEDTLALAQAVKMQIRTLLDSAFSHPELLGLPNA